MQRRDFIFSTGALVIGSSFVGETILSSCQRREKNPQLPLVKMQAAWVNDAEFMGYFIGMRNGYYEQNGIKLEYFPGGPEIIPEGKLLANEVDLALTTPDTTINLILEENAPLKIIGTQYQKSPLGVVSLKSSNINSPKDLVGKAVAVAPINLIGFKAMLQLNDIKISDVKIVPYAYDPTPLVQGEVDATIDFVTNVPYTIQQKGKEANYFLLYDYGFTMYNNTIVVAEETLRTRRDELKAWLKASRMGWMENFKNTSKYPKIFMESYFKSTGRTLDNEIFFNEKQRELIEIEDGIFYMNKADIDLNIESLNRIGIKATSQMFDNSLLEEIIDT